MAEYKLNTPLTDAAIEPLKAGDVVFRITSYNVCYTKLLRRKPMMGHS